MPRPFWCVSAVIDKTSFTSCITSTLKNHIVPGDAADGLVQAGSGVYCGDFPGRSAGAGGPAAERAVEPVCRPLRV